VCGDTSELTRHHNKKIFIAKSYIFLIFALIIDNVNANSENRHLKNSPKEDAPFQSEKSVIGIVDNPSSIGLSYFMENLIKQLRYPEQNLIGQRFGRLLVVELVDIFSYQYQYARKRITQKWKCVCDCGNEKIANTFYLKYRKSEVKSCGCYGKEMHLKRWRKFTPNAALNQVVFDYKTGAKVRGLEFNLTHEEAEAFFIANCYYCNIEPFCIKKSGKHEFVYNGIDRIDNDKGYDKDNMVTCCKLCNVAKHAMSYEDFIKWISRLANNLIKNKIILLDENI